IIEYIKKSKEEGCKLVIFPDLALTGNPPGSLLKRPDFVKACGEALACISKHVEGIGVLLGTPLMGPNLDMPANAIVLLEDGQVAASIYKGETCLQEQLAFEPMIYKGVRLGIMLNDKLMADYSGNSNEANVKGIKLGEEPDILINISGIPYQHGRQSGLVDKGSNIAKSISKPTIYVNQVGGNGELIYNGSSLVFNKDGDLIRTGKAFDEDLIVYRLNHDRPAIASPKEDISWAYMALVLGLRDYMQKSGMKKVLLGLSGGIDSALVACIVADALGKENVLGINMPSRYSPDHSINDARDLAQNLGIGFRLLAINDIFTKYIELMNGSDRTMGDLTEENIQARIRGDLLMYVSNREGHMLVCPSNKSEAAVGYTTMYGDMCGGLALIADIPKTMVYSLCNYINRDRVIIPESTMTKPPSAELSPDQVDADSLPPYEILDPIIDMYLEENLSVDDMVKRGYDRHMVVDILNMIDRAEYKRRQMPPVLRVTSNPARLANDSPLVNGFRWTKD
ncbi:MAG TPA: NAD+ synthase, partial [Bacillota bacterium]|nr:NAD+ synthase [Bacillota bacterium]